MQSTDAQHLRVSSRKLLSSSYRDWNTVRVTHLHLDDTTQEAVDRLCDLPLMQHLVSLILIPRQPEGGALVTALDLHRLLGATDRQSLESLTLPWYGMQTIEWLRGSSLASSLRSLTLISWMGFDDDGRRLPTPDIGASNMEALVALPWKSLESLSLGPLGADGLDELLRSPLRFKKLSLNEARLDPRDAERLAASPAVASLEELHLAGNPLGVGAIAIARSSQLQRLRHLDLRGQHSNAVFQGFFSALALPALEKLIIESNDLGPTVAEAIARSQGLGTVRSLFLGHNGLGDEGMRALASADLPSLELLSISSNGITSDGVEALCKAPFAPRLHHLDLAGNRLDGRAAKALALAPLPRLEKLFVDESGLSDDAVAGILENSSLAMLSHFDAPHTRAFIAAFLHGSVAPLERLSLNDATRAQLLELASAPRASCLRRVQIYNSHFDDPVAIAFARSPHLADLKSLTVFSRTQELTQAGIAALTNTFGERAVIND